ncbi:MAG: SMC-Scp complex subunit ScpB [Oceanococcaceae bacterium]
MNQPLVEILRALLLASDTPLSLSRLLDLLREARAIDRAQLREALDLLSGQLEGSSLELVEVASGLRIQVREAYTEWVRKLWQEKPQKYSRALLETLALIVYRQPLTRGDIEEIRGVSLSANILKTLLERGWVQEVGHREGPGRPALLATTRQFLDDFNLRSLDQLPTLPDLDDPDRLEEALKALDLDVAALRAEAEAAAAENADAEEAPTPPSPDAETESLENRDV